MALFALLHRVNRKSSGGCDLGHGAAVSAGVMASPVFGEQRSLGGASWWARKKEGNDCHAPGKQGANIRTTASGDGTQPCGKQGARVLKPSAFVLSLPLKLLG
jgi:hypothetical protein